MSPSKILGWKGEKYPIFPELFNCTFRRETNYDCKSIFDWRYYIRTNKLEALRFKNASEAETHFLVTGIKHGLRWHNGSRIMKIVLMTKNEYPLIKSWILYHGHIFGYKNLYIVDSSDDAETLSFLRNSSSLLGVNVFLTPGSNLNTLENDINTLMRNLRKTADYIIKMDSDEFLVMIELRGTGQTREVRGNPADSLIFDRASIERLLDTSTFDGSRYQVGYLVEALHRSNCSATDDTALYSQQFKLPHPTDFKVYHAAWTFQRVGLGAHEGHVVEPYFNQSRILRTNLAIIHYHFHCYQRMVSLTLQALKSHKYLNGSETPPLQIEILRNLTTGFERGYCGCTSCHKAFAYMKYLQNPKGEEQEYNTNWMESIPMKADVFTFPEFKSFLRKLHHTSPF
jgi:hypothetical protein